MSQSLRTVMTRTLALVALGTGLCLVIPTPAQARQDTKPAAETDGDLPAGRDIIESAIKNNGGREAFEKITALSVFGVMYIPARGMSVDIEMHSAPDGRFLFKHIMPGMGEIMSIGSDGTLGWSLNSMSGGFELIEGDDLKQGMRQANLLKILLNIADRYDTIETVELGTFDDEATYKVRCADDEDEQFLYFSVDEHVFRAVESEGDMGLAILRFKDWETMGDVKFFKKMLISQGGVEMEMNFKEIKVNDTDLAVFEAPDDVKKLAEEKAAAEPASQPDN